MLISHLMQLKSSSFLLHLSLRHCCLKNCHQITVTTLSCPFSPAAILKCLCLQTECSVLQSKDRCSKNPWSLLGSCLLSEESLPVSVFQLNSLNEIHDLFQKPETRKGNGAVRCNILRPYNLQWAELFCQVLSVQL